jgi:hypothetical protein
VESEKNRFTIVVKTKEKIDLSLELDPLVQHGHVIEVDGQDRSWSAGDGERQGSAHGQRRWFVPLFHAALAKRGEPDHGDRAECLKGGVNTHQEKVVIQ